MGKRKIKFDCDPACPDFAGIRVVGETKSLKSVVPPYPQDGRILRNFRHSICRAGKTPPPNPFPQGERELNPMNWELLNQKNGRLKPSATKKQNPS